MNRRRACQLVAAAASGSFAVALSERGYHVHGYENVLARPLGADLMSNDAVGGTNLTGVTVRGMLDETGAPMRIPTPRQVASGLASGLTTERLRAEDERTWSDIAVTAFTNLDGTGSAADDSVPRAELEEALTDFAGAPGFLRYLARLDGKPLAWAACASTAISRRWPVPARCRRRADVAYRRRSFTGGWPTRAQPERIWRW
jgi:hypothetical protein